jgi:hypothetical protein
MAADLFRFNFPYLYIRSGEKGLYSAENMATDTGYNTSTPNDLSSPGFSEAAKEYRESDKRSNHTPTTLSAINPS